MVGGEDAKEYVELDEGHNSAPDRIKEFYTLVTKTTKKHKKAIIDDLTLLENTSLKNLEVKERIIGPPPYHDRFHLTLPENKSILQRKLHDLVKYTKDNHMFLNSNKTKCLPVNNSLTKDLVPQLSVEPGRNFEVI